MDSMRRHGRMQDPAGSAVLRVPLANRGTGFTGPEQVEYAIARGHRVTLFNRNKTRPDFFKGKVAEELVGDLNGDKLPDLVVGGMKGSHVLIHERQPVSREKWLEAQPKAKN